MLALLLLGCPVAPLDTGHPATEIGNPELTTRMRATSTNPSWIGLDGQGTLQLESVWVHVDHFVVHGCDGSTATTDGGWLDLLDPDAPVTVASPADTWCSIELTIVPVPAPANLDFQSQASGWMTGTDVLGAPFSIALRQQQVATIDTDATPADQAYHLVVDVIPWLEGLDLTQARDADLVGTWDGSASLFSDDGDGIWSEGIDTELVPRTAVVPDRDADGIRDSQEEADGSDPDVADTDGDQLDDGLEVVVVATDPVLADSDGDGIEDGEEVASGTNPLSPDADRDGFDADEDCDDQDPTINPAAQDTPGDGIDQDCDGIDG